MVVAVNMVAIITVVLHLHVVVVPFEVEAGVEDGVEVGVVLGPVVERRIADEVRCDLDPVPVRLVVVRGLQLIEIANESETDDRPDDNRPDGRLLTMQGDLVVPRHRIEEQTRGTTVDSGDILFLSHFVAHSPGSRARDVVI